MLTTAQRNPPSSTHCAAPVPHLADAGRCRSTERCSRMALDQIVSSIDDTAARTSALRASAGSSRVHALPLPHLPRPAPLAPSIPQALRSSALWCASWLCLIRFRFSHCLCCCAVNRIVARSENYEMDLVLDINSQLYKLLNQDKFVLVLASTLNPDGTPDSNEFNQSGEPSLMDNYGPTHTALMSRLDVAFVLPLVACAPAAVRLYCGCSDLFAFAPLLSVLSVCRVRDARQGVQSGFERVEQRRQNGSVHQLRWSAHVTERRAAVPHENRIGYENVFAH